MVNEKLYMVAALKISTENLGRKSLRNRLVAHSSWLIAHRQKSPPKQGGLLIAHGS